MQMAIRKQAYYNANARLIVCSHVLALKIRLQFVCNYGVTYVIYDRIPSESTPNCG
jgi:hypothetical protein